MTPTRGWLRPEADIQHPPVHIRRDWVLAGLVAGATLVEVLAREDLVWRPLALAFGLTLAFTMLWRRSRPLTMVGLAFGALLLLDLAWLLAFNEPFVLYAGTFVLVLVYSLFRWGTPLQAAIGALIVLAEWCLSVTTDFTGVTDAVGGLVVLLLAAAIGLSIRYRAIVRDQMLNQARLHERETLSRELHDTVAHHVSAIAIQAQAGRFLATSDNPEGAARALSVIETEASRALAEMRSMVGSLRRRDDTDSRPVQHALTEMEGLATADGSPGLRVYVERRADLDDLPPSMQAALYRVAQEAITNAQRHARHASRVDVLLDGDSETVRLSVTDDGERGHFGSRSPGYGLVGMAERVSLLGGTLEAGTAPTRGWAVQATIPRQPGRA
ncbi:MAG: histidine kinase [Ornithinimicrobium sp.]